MSTMNRGVSVAPRASRYSILSSPKDVAIYTAFENPRPTHRRHPTQQYVQGSRDVGVETPRADAFAAEHGTSEDSERRPAVTHDRGNSLSVR